MAEPTLVSAPDFKEVVLTLTSTAPYVQSRFSKRDQIKKGMEEGNPSKSKRKRDPRNYDQEFKDAQHIMADGRRGIPVAAFRNAAISACRLVNFKMTRAKLSIFVVADGIDKEDGTPLVAIEGEPEQHVAHVRNATGVIDIRIRAMWREWRATVRIRYDADQFTESDVRNLFARAGMQVGIGEGRPDSRESAGMGWGTFRVD